MELLVVVSIMGLLVGIVLPNFVQAHQESLSTICCQNLEALEDAKSQWAFATGAGDFASPDIEDLEPFLAESITPLCPARGLYNLNTTGSSATPDPATCTFSEGIPGQHSVF